MSHLDESFVNLLEYWRGRRAQLHCLGECVRMRARDDRLRARRVLERLERLVVIGRGGRDRCEHDRVGVAAEGWLEDVSELRGAIRDVIRGALSRVGECVDDVAEGRERLVNCNRLLKGLALGARLARPLRAR